MFYEWELRIAREWSTSTIKDRIWSAVANGQPVPGCLSVESLREVLRERGEDDRGYHNT